MVSAQTAILVSALAPQAHAKPVPSKPAPSKPDPIAPAPAPTNVKPDNVKPDYEAAKLHYQNAENAAAEKDWSSAAKEYGIAYEITRDAVLFFKLGNAYQLSGDCTRAVEYYERYLKEAKPSEEYASDTQTRIHSCQSSLSEGVDADNGDAEEDPSQAGDSPLAPTLGSSDDGEELPSLPEQPSFMDEDVTWQTTAAWTSVGLSVAFLSAGAVLGLSARSREEDMNNLLSYTDPSGRPASFGATVRSRYEDLEDEGDKLNSLSIVAFGLAGVSATAAVLFFILDDSPSAEEQGLSSLAPMVSDDAFGINAGFRF